MEFDADFHFSFTRSLSIACLYLRTQIFFRLLLGASTIVRLEIKVR